MMTQSDAPENTKRINLPAATIAAIPLTTVALIVSTFLL